MFSAAEVGEPHQRKRVFILGWLPDACGRRLMDAVQRSQCKAGVGTREPARGGCGELADTAGERDRKSSEGIPIGNQRLPGDKKVQPMLADACKKNWQTPRVSDERDGSRNRIYKPEAQLREQVMRQENWPTPTTAEAEKISNQPNYGQKGLSNHPAIVGDTEREKLAKSRGGQAGPAKRSTIGKNPEQWPTPRAAENDENLETWDKRRERKQKEGINLHLPLSVKVRKEDNWPTPRAANPGSRKPGTGGKVLSEEAKNWPTPLEDDASNVNPSDKRMKTLVSSTKGSGMKLNPNWVEQLMGLPGGWTQLPAHWLTG